MSILLHPLLSASSHPNERRVYIYFRPPHHQRCFWPVSSWITVSCLDNTNTRSAAVAQLCKLYNGSTFQSSGAVCTSRWTSWAPAPNKPTVSVDVKQHFSNNVVPFKQVVFGVLDCCVLSADVTRTGLAWLSCCHCAGSDGRLVMTAASCGLRILVLSGHCCYSHVAVAG